MNNKEAQVIDLQSLKERLSQQGVKVTSQRLVIYQSLLMQYDHPSAEMVFERIKPSHPSISLATVYKTLDALVAAGLAKKVKTGDDLLRFDAKTENHNHLYCTNTSQIIDFEDDELQSLIADYFSQRKFENFKMNDFQLQINGEIIQAGKTIKLKQSK